MKWKPLLFSYFLLFALLGSVLYAQSGQSKSPTTISDSMNGVRPNVSHEILPPIDKNARHGWKQTLNEEFHGSNLSKCWKTSYTGNVHTLVANGEQEWYVTPVDKAGFNPFSVSNGVLSIKAVPSASEPQTNAHGHPYLSGMIMNDGCFAQTYGYFEIKVRVPEGKGLWPAFWLLPSSHNWPPEADVFEMFGAPNSRHEGGIGWVHTGTVGCGTGTFNNWHKVNIDQYTSFHTYGLLWGPQIMAIYIDGKLIATQATPKQFHQPMYLIANLAVGGRWPESPDAATHFPAVMEVDSIRAWQYVPWRPHALVESRSDCQTRSVAGNG